MRVLLQLIGEPAAGAEGAPAPLGFDLDGRAVSVVDHGGSLLEVLREQLGVRSVKDGCSPQGQCGCCTVWVDGAPRVACVTPARRVAGRQVTTLDGLDPQVLKRWSSAMVSTGASQCGFCTPGIVMRLAWLEERGARLDSEAVGRTLAAHLCRCTGWRTIAEAVGVATGSSTPPAGDRDMDAASERAEVEGGSAQRVGEAVVQGGGGFADDTAPAGALVAVPSTGGRWVVADTVAAARRAAGAVPGRNSTVSLRHPVPPPPGDFAVRLNTTFVEPAYLEPDASWCEPGGRPMTPLANGGAFGAKRHSAVTEAARRLADEHGRAVRALFSREDVARLGPKRPPVAAGIRADGTGVIRVGRTPGSGDLGEWRRAVESGFPGLEIEELEVAGPPVSCDIRAAGWAEAAVLRAGWEAISHGHRGPGRPVTVTSPQGASATVTMGEDGTVSASVSAGPVLDGVVLRSYVIGAVHQALGWVWREGLAVDDEGAVLDLTIRSFGILPAARMPPVDVSVEDGVGPPRRAGDAVFAATACAAWLAAGMPPEWPLERRG